MSTEPSVWKPIEPDVDEADRAEINAAANALNFEDTEIAYRMKTTKQILLGWAVFKICTFKPLVQNAGTLVKMSETFLGKKFTYGVLRSTFFAHFCAGVDAEDILPTINALKAAGVGSILDYAAEADVPITQEGLEPTDGIISARVYEYDGEHKCDQNAETSLQAIEAAGRQEDGFAAVKLTALGRPEFLTRMSVMLGQIRMIFRSLDKRPEAVLPEADFGNVISWLEFKNGLKRQGVTATETEMRRVFEMMDIDQNGVLEYSNWIESLSPETMHTHPFYLMVAPAFGADRLSVMTDKEQTELQNLIGRTRKLAAQAAKHKVKLMIDAEQTYFQPAIDHVVALLQAQYNKEEPVIFNTFQCYCKDTYARVQIDLERSYRGGYCFAAKIVRGAYMFQERALAREEGRPDPIFPNIEGTNRSYHDVLELILANFQETRAAIMVASHNERSVRRAVGLMHLYGISHGVFFGQLLGMCDFISLTLGAMGYKVMKYVPYGPVDEVLPYLVRRAQENTDMLTGGAAKERRLLRRELLRRLTSRSHTTNNPPLHQIQT